MEHKILSVFLILSVSFGSLLSQNYIDNIEDIQNRLQVEKQSLRNQVEVGGTKTFQSLSRLQEIGDWDYVSTAVANSRDLSKIEKMVLISQNLWLHNDFFGAENVLKQLSKKQQKAAEVQRLLAILEVESWRLVDAENRIKEVLNKNKGDVKARIILGQNLILQKKYDQAFLLGNDMIIDRPEDAAGYFLMADVHFWNQQPDKAEEFVKKGLKLDPLNADARFSYGYAIWRRIDATQLNDMVAQWEFALILNPLHFRTHWHIGNGHTNRTFADYADPNEDIIRKKLEEADSLFTDNQFDKAIKVTKIVGKEYPESVLPQMHEASLLYSDFDSKNRQENLKKAEAIFLSILEQKKHYGPAHNGLAAVIKSERIPYLNDYNSLYQKMKHPSITNMNDLLEVFPDVAYYPGNMVKGMVWNQMYASVVYFPFLVEQQRSFTIPPLHKDLAIVMNAPYFRFNTTFDNRQWMDIRGVGSGAAGIGYVERGAYGERNVILHEFVHLYHQQVMTDEEKREIRSHYYNAMKNGLTLDYYSQNNEHEYFAQTYPAYFEPEKVHPLDFKSMNATPELKQKDPKMYEFLDKLVKRQNAYLNGDKEAMASNWAQIYVNIALKEYRTNHKEGYDFLEKALSYDQNYLPTYITYAQFLIQDNRLDEAASKLKKAKSIDQNYAPIYIQEARLIGAKHPENIEEQAELYKKAYALETDLMERASNSIVLRDFYFDKGLLKEAIATGEEYIQTGSTISTYLRDRIDEAKGFIAWQQSLLKQPRALVALEALVAQRPFNYILRRRYAEGLLANSQHQKAVEVLQLAYRDISASRVNRPDYEVLMAVAYHELKDDSKSKEFIELALDHSKEGFELESASKYQLVNLLISIGDLNRAEALLKDDISNRNHVDKSYHLVVQAALSLKKGDEKDALSRIEEALTYYPYQVNAIGVIEKLSPKYEKARDLHESLKMKF